MARPRMNKCTECRKRKKRCDGQQPGCTRNIMSPNNVASGMHSAHHTPNMTDAFSCAQLPVDVAMQFGNIVFTSPQTVKSAKGGAAQIARPGPMQLAAEPGYSDVFGVDGAAMEPQTDKVDTQTMQTSIGTVRRPRVVHQNFSEIFNKVKRNKSLRPSLAQSAPTLLPANGIAGSRPVLARHPTMPYSLPKGPPMAMGSVYNGTGDGATLAPTTQGTGMYSNTFSPKDLEEDSNKAIIKRMALPPLSSKPSALSGSGRWQDSLPLACDSSVSTNGMISPEALGLDNLQSIAINDCFGGLSPLAQVDLIHEDTSSPFGLLSAVGCDVHPSADIVATPDRCANGRTALSLATATLNSVLTDTDSLAWESSEMDADWAAMVLNTTFEQSDWGYGYGVRSAIGGAACFPSLYTPANDTLPDLLGSTEA